MSGKVGRPPKSESEFRGRTICVRLTPAEVAALDAHIARHGLASVSVFVRCAIAYTIAAIDAEADALEGVR